ncbi:MAG: hypothetical protein EPO22_06215 [Dehalococcoidia bacterium]|nr:MAG: hypothetical protein EPO22_06215 [Dehalococcoidia bacterium]
MFIEANYHHRFRELREKDLERAWRRRELARLARTSDPAFAGRVLATLRSIRRRTSSADARAAADAVSGERTIPWSA